MINSISFCKSYEKCEIMKIKWIHDYNNLADFIIKSKLFSLFKILTNTNQINLDITEQIKQAEQKKETIKN